MEEWAFLFDLLFRYLEACHETSVVLQKLRGRPNYPECRQKFIDTVIPAIHRYTVQLRKLALKHLGRDGQTFIMKRWISETRTILEEFDVPINRLELVEVRGGINLDLRHQSQLSSLKSTSQEILYDRRFSRRPTKRAKSDIVSVADLPELVPDLPQAVVACETEELQDNSEIIFNPFYFQM